MKTPDFKSRAEGSMLGLAVGDALGAPVEFGHTSYDIRWEMKNLRHMKENRRGDKGIWTDDTSMALCIADSLLEKNGYDSYDLMEKYKDWMINGYRSYYPMGDGIGIRTQEAIETYIEDPIIHLDTPKTDSIGNGCIMRLAPIVIANFENTPENILEAAKLSCRETHDSVGAMATTELMAASLYLVLEGEEKPKILEQAIQMVKEPELKDFLDREDHLHNRIFDKTGDTLRDLGGYAIDCFDIAMWGLLNFDNFEYGMLGVIGLGGDTDTNAAVFGQLAGAYYGVETIPEEWRNDLYLGDEIKELADSLTKMKKFDVLRTRFEDDKYFKEK